jgi:hypothetical protein
MMDAQNQPIPIDTAVIDNYGYYYFYQILEGKHIVKARLQDVSTEYGNFIPTYYGDVHLWDQASIMDVQHDNWTYHINLIRSEDFLPGGGQIFGQISYDTNDNIGLIPAENIEIILLNNSSVCLTCRLSDLEGNFAFSNLDFGTYQIVPDVTGIRCMPMYITLTEEQPGDEEVNVVIQEEQIKLSIGDDASEFIEAVSSVFPNPARDFALLRVNLKKQARVEVSIFSISGQMISQTSYQGGSGDRDITLDLRGLRAGSYYVAVTSEDNRPFVSKFIKID